jgi:hypothetical protein
LPPAAEFAYACASRQGIQSSGEVHLDGNTSLSCEAFEVSMQRRQQALARELGRVQKIGDG